MASVVGLLEERELAARQRVDSLREEADRVLVALRDAEADWQQWVIAREKVDQVLAEPRGQEAMETAETPAPAAVPRSGPAPGSVARAGSIVPVWRSGLAVGVLAAEYQRIVNLLADRQRAGEDKPMNCQEIATALGVELVPAKIEGAVRSRAKRLVARGWLAEEVPGRFSIAAGPGGGS